MNRSIENVLILVDDLELHSDHSDLSLIPELCSDLSLIPFKNKQCAKGRQTPFAFGGSSAGAGGKSSLPSGQRARTGAMAGERFCLWT